MDSKKIDSVELTQEEIEKILKETFGDFQSALKKIEDAVMQFKDDTTSKV